MSVQTGILIMLYYIYNKKTLAAGVFPVIYSILAYLLVSGRTPEHLVVKLFSLNVPLLIISKVSLVITFIHTKLINIHLLLTLSV